LGQKDLRKNKKTMIWLVSLLLLIGLIALSQSHVIQRIIDDVLYDNYNHYVPCNRLPLAAEVEGVAADHNPVVDRIQAISPDVQFEIVMQSCGGAEHADVVIYYPSHAQREQIEALLGAKTFFGVPARWINW
jgi:uncharacterized protein YbbC (DUF1343 family)